MIIYRSEQQLLDIPRELDCLPGLSDPTDRLIRAGEIEAGIADALCPESDSDGDAIRWLRRLAISVARESPRETAESIAALGKLELPRTAQVGVPEGYAWYALYPEMYRAAARRFAREQNAREAVVLGIRNIGTSLSAVVAAELESAGCAVRSWTVRPRGHPFQRELVLDERLEQELAEQRGAWFAVVDEGPGLSGSSMTSVAEKLAALGAPEGRIVLFPSWAPDGSAFVSEAARERWKRHAKYTTPFEEIAGRIAGCATGQDLGAGQWRRLLYGSERDWPAVQPQHERRKYLSRGRLYKFAGLGRFGRSKFELARELAGAGFSPPAAGLADGFIEFDFVPGRPLAAADAGRPLLDRIAGYLNWRAGHLRAAKPVVFDPLAEMIRVNVEEALGPGEVCDLERWRGMIGGQPAVAVDGRMQPHEWLATAGGYLKTDSTDHHDDHFVPGFADIAWDIAGACVESELSEDATTYLVSRCADRELERRLPFYILAYLSFRVGYAAMAGNADAGRFHTVARRQRPALATAARRCR
jgi:hypothetical protein